MNITDKINALDEVSAKRELATFLEMFNAPAFGAMPKREIELSVFELLRNLGLVDEKATIYSLMTDLRITRAKASQLLFDLEVRKHGGDSNRLNEAIKEALVATKFAKDGDYFVMEIENPLILAHLRQKFRDLGHVTDTSFNASLVRAPLDAVTDLMLNIIADDRHGEIKQALEDAGAPEGMTVKGVLKGALKTLGKKVMGEAADQVAEAVVDNASAFISPILGAATEAITTQWNVLFNENADEAQPNA